MKELNANNKLVKAIYTLAVVLLILIAVFLLWDLMTILILALILSYVIEVTSTPLERLIRSKGGKLSHDQRIALTYALVLIGIALIGFLVIPPLYRDIGHIISELPNYTKALGKLMNKLFASLSSVPFLREDKLKDLLEGVSNQLLASIGSVASKFYTGLTSALSSAVAVVGILVIVPIFSFYISYTKDSLYRIIVDIFPKSYRTEVSLILISFDKAMKKYIKALLINTSAISVLSALALAPFLGASSIGLGIIYGISSIVPIIGPLFGASIGIVIALSKGLVTGVIVIAIYILVQQICDNLITPKILGESMNIPPLLVILSMALFYKLLGIAGPLIAVPVTYTLIKVLSRWASNL